jgi:hypothetical protein
LLGFSEAPMMAKERGSSAALRRVMVHPCKT